MKTKRVSVSVPLRSQPYNSGWCVPVATQMVLAFYGDEVELRDIVSAMDVPRKKGVDVIKASMYLLRRGYEVRIALWDVDFPPSFAAMHGCIPPKRFLAWAKRRVRRPSWIRMSCRIFGPEFVALGGKIEARPATVGMIRSALRRQKPPIVIVNVTTLWRVAREGDSHAVVPVAIDDKTIVINDPSPNRQRTSYPLDAFLHAFYRNEGMAMFIRPKR